MLTSRKKTCRREVSNPGLLASKWNVEPSRYREDTQCNCEPRENRVHWQARISTRVLALRIITSNFIFFCTFSWNSAWNDAVRSGDVRVLDELASAKLCRQVQPYHGRTTEYFPLCKLWKYFSPMACNLMRERFRALLSLFYFCYEKPKYSTVTNRLK